MRKFLLGSLALITWFGREWLKEVFWERILHVLNPENTYLLQYGVPLAFASAWLYFIVSERRRTRREMLAIAIMIVSAACFIGGVLLYRGEVGTFPFSEKKDGAEKEPESIKPAILPSDTLLANKLPIMKKEDSSIFGGDEALPERHPTNNDGPTFFKQGAGSIVEGLEIDGVETSGMKTDFDIQGILKNPKISNYRSDANPQPFGAGHVYVKHMYIGSVRSAPIPKIGPIQPSNNVSTKKNKNGSFTSVQPMFIDSESVIDIVFAIKGEDIAGFYILKNGKDVPLIILPSKDGRIIKIYKFASGVFDLCVVKKAAESKADIGIDYRPSEVFKP